MTSNGISENQDKGRGSWISRIAWPAGLALGVLMLFAAPASAKNEFENGFKDELGRLAAQEVVHVGRGVVGQVVAIDSRRGGRRDVERFEYRESYRQPVVVVRPDRRHYRPTYKRHYKRHYKRYYKRHHKRGWRSGWDRRFRRHYRPARHVHGPGCRH